MQNGQKQEKKGFKGLLDVYKWALIFGGVQFALWLWQAALGAKAFHITYSNLEQMMMLIPPIFIIMGLMDVWVPKEALMKYMGKGSGAVGLLIAFILGTVAAGPIYIAFPMGVLLLKKGAKLANVIFFFGVWSSTKLPIVLFEVASFGAKFTLIHILVSLPLYLLIAYYIESRVSAAQLAKIVEEA